MAIETVTYCLHSTVAAFVHWISERTQSECPRKFPARYSEGYYILQPVRLPSQEIGQRPLTLEMTGSHVPESAEAKVAPPESWAIRFKLVPLLPRKREIEVTVECNEYLVQDYFEQLLIAIGWAFPAVPGGNEAKRVRATTGKIAAITDKMGYKSGLELIVETTMEALNQCLQKFHSMRPDKGWIWDTAPTIGKTRFTRLVVHTNGVSCRGDQIWYVKALDVSSDDELGTPFCIISARPLLDWSDSNVLNVNCWPDWNKGYIPLSYREYLAALLEGFQRCGIIEYLPDWLTESERTEPPMHTGSDTGRVGRPPLTEEQWQERFADVENVLQKHKDLRITLKQACARVGIPHSTFQDWRREMMKRQKMTKNDEKVTEK